MMNLKAISQAELNLIRLKTPLPFSIYDKYGMLLMASGSTIYSEERLNAVRTGDRFIKIDEAAAVTAVVNKKTVDLINANAPLKAISSVNVTLQDVKNFNQPANLTHDLSSEWADSLSRLDLILHDTSRRNWLSDFEHIHSELNALVDRDADAALFILMQEAQNPTGNYSTSHVALVMTVCKLIFKKNFAHLSSTDCARLTRAALTMNLTIMELQDTLAVAFSTPTPDQRRQLDSHSTGSSVLLKKLGVTDEDWRKMIQLHHIRTAGPFNLKPQLEQFARILHRVDVYTARLSARASRKALNSHDAATNIFRDELGHRDAVGDMIIKTIGLYPPGCFLTLKNKETAISIARGSISHQPKCLSVVGADGMPFLEPVKRDTARPEFSAVAGASAHKINVRVNAGKWLKLR